MARKKKETGTAMTNWDEQLANMAQEAAAGETTSDKNWLSINYQASKFTFNDEIIEPPLEVVILASTFENAYYDTAYDPDNPTTPTCFAFNEDSKQQVPHEDSPEAQADDCASCEFNQFGSAETGKGKACRNVRRLAVIHSDSLENEESVAAAEMVLLRISPTSMKYYAAYVKKLAATIHRPPIAVVTDFNFMEDKRGNVLNPQFVENVPNELLGALMARQEEAMAALNEPYEAIEAEEPVKKVAKKKTAKKKVAKKKAAKRKF